MREAPVTIIVMNTNGQSPYEPIATDRHAAKHPLPRPRKPLEEILEYR